MNLHIVNASPDDPGMGMPPALTVWQVLSLCAVVDQIIEVCSVQAAEWLMQGNAGEAGKWQKVALDATIARNSALVGRVSWTHEATLAALKKALTLVTDKSREGVKDDLVAAGEGVLERAGIVGE